MNMAIQSDDVRPEVQVEAELLSILMHNASGYSRVSDRLQPHYFYLEAHRQIYAGMQELSQAGHVISPLTLRPLLPETLKVGNLSAAAYLLHLHSGSGSIIQAVDYATMVRDAWAIRAVANIAAEAQTNIISGRIDGAKETINTFIDGLASIRSAVNSDSVPMDMRAASEAADRIMNGNAGEHETGIPLPFPSLREVLQEDLMPGRLYGFLAASGEGKTSFILPVMRHAAENGHPCAMLSFDQDGRTCLDQMVTQSLSIEPWRIQRRALSDEQKQQIREERSRIADLPLAVIQSPNEGIEGVLQRASSFVDYWKQRTVKAPLIIIDHIMAINDHDSRVDAGQKAQHKNRAFRNWAIRNGAVAGMINQRNSSGMRDIDRWLPRPTVRDLTGGEAARQDYDTIIGLFRPEWWRDEALKRIGDSDERQIDKINALYGDCDKKLEISLIKARHGNPRKRSTLKFEGAYTQVSEFQREQGSLLGDEHAGVPF